MSPSSRSPTSTAALVLLGSLVVALPLLRGGVDWRVQVAAVVLAAAAALLAAGSRQGVTPVAAAGLAIVTFAMALQLVPVPPFLHRLSPGARDLFDAVLRPIGLYPGARPFSLDPPASGRELAKAVAALLAFAATARVAVTRRRQEGLLATVALAGAAASGAGLVAALLGYGPLLEARLTFVNPNHLAGFLNLTAFVALGFALRSIGQARLLWLLTFAVSGSGVFFSLSRGGIAAFFVGAAVFGFLYVRRLRLETQEMRTWRYAIVPAALSVALSIAAYLALDRVLAEMRTVKTAASEVKLSLWPLGLSMLRESPLTGIGRGSFATAFAAYKAEPDPVTFTHLENEWLQPLVDLGIPVGLLLVGTVAWIWLRAARARDLSRPEMGALAGTAALVAQNTVDFSLELLGAAIPFAVVLGVLARTQPPLRVGAWAMRAGTAVALALAAAGMGLFLAHPTEADAARVARARSADEAAPLARAAAAWHPADYLPQMVAGTRFVQEGRCAEGLPWLERAMRLNPTAAEPHRFAARCLAAAGRDALARQEYRLAFLFGDREALKEATRRYSTLDELLTIVPDTPAGLGALSSLLLGMKRPTDAAEVLRRSWDEFRSLDALRSLSSVALQLGELEEALALARRLREQQPLDPSSYLVASSALARLGRTEEARAELEQGASRVPGSPPIVAALAEQALAARRFSEAARLAETMAARTAPEIASKRLFLARVFWAQGRMAEAIQEARSARDAVPNDPGPLLSLASYCSQAGRFDEAIAAVERARALPGARPGAYDTRLAELRAARQAQIDRRNREQYLGNPAPLPR